MNKFITFALFTCIAFMFGCNSQEIPQTHKGRMFDKTGSLALWAGGKGFEGPVLLPGTYFTGIYPEIRLVNCAQQTHKETMQALTKDGVQFNLDLFVRYSANCASDDSVKSILENMSPEKVDKTYDVNNKVITESQLYNTYIIPAISESVRESVSPYIANEINIKREEVFTKIKTKFFSLVKGQTPQLVEVYDINLSNLDFPEEMDKANVERATQSILKDKAIAEREKVAAEIETAKQRQELIASDAENEAKRINIIGDAYKKNPEYAAIKLYDVAGQKGNLIVSPTTHPVIFQQK